MKKTIAIILISICTIGLIFWACSCNKSTEPEPEADSFQEPEITANFVLLNSSAMRSGPYVIIENLPADGADFKRASIAGRGVQGVSGYVSSAMAFSPPETEAEFGGFIIDIRRGDFPLKRIWNFANVRFYRRNPLLSNNWEINGLYSNERPSSITVYERSSNTPLSWGTIGGGTWPGAGTNFYCESFSEEFIELPRVYETSDNYYQIAFIWPLDNMVDMRNWALSIEYLAYLEPDVDELDCGDIVMRNVKPQFEKYRFNEEIPDVFSIYGFYFENEPLHCSFGNPTDMTDPQTLGFFTWAADISHLVLENPFGIRASILDFNFAENQANLESPEIHIAHEETEGEDIELSGYGLEAVGWTYENTIDDYITIGLLTRGASSVLSLIGWEIGSFISAVVALLESGAALHDYLNAILNERSHSQVGLETFYDSAWKKEFSGNFTAITIEVRRKLQCNNPDGNTEFYFIASLDNFPFEFSRQFDPEYEEEEEEEPDPPDPIELTEVGNCVIPGSGNEVHVSGSYAYVAAYYGGLRIIDVSTPSTPFEVGCLSLRCQVRSVFVSGSHAYVGNDYRGLRVIDVSSPSNPSEVGHYDSLFYCGDVFVSGAFAYVLSTLSLLVIDVTTPSSPCRVGHISSGGRTVYVSGSYAYVADDNGLRIIDVSTPSAPYQVGFYETPGHAYDVFVSGSYVYVADLEEGLRIIDVSTPSDPYEIGFYETPGHAYDVFVSGSFAYVISSRGLLVLDVSTPSSPCEVGYYGSYGSGVSSVYVSGSHAFVTHADDYLYSRFLTLDVSQFTGE